MQRDRMVLLPFDVRLNRLTDITGVAASDNMYSALRARRLDLGAHDYGANVAPNLTWSAQRMTAWVVEVAKVCDDPRMRTRYPDWTAANLERFARSAWGRAASADDARAVTEIATEAGSDVTAQWRANCIALLSTAELVLQ